MVGLGNYSGEGLWVYDQAAHAAFDNDATHMDENIIWVEVGEPLRGWEHLVVGSKIFGKYMMFTIVGTHLMETYLTKQCRLKGPGLVWLCSHEVSGPG